MKSLQINLDRVLFRILKDEEVKCFTVMELREAYCRYVDPNGVSMPSLRLYLYDQIRKLVDRGWVSYHEERKSRGQQFVLNSMPRELRVKPIAPKRGMRELDSRIRQSKLDDQALEKTGDLGSSAVVKVRGMLKQARLSFLTSLGETDQYKRLLEEIPELKESLGQSLAEARDNSSKLLGRINALEATLQKLEAFQ